MGPTKGDTRSLDYSSYMLPKVICKPKNRGLRAVDMTITHFPLRALAALTIASTRYSRKYHYNLR